MEVNIQTLVSQLHGLSLQTVGELVGSPADKSLSASQINAIHRSQLDMTEMLKDMMQAVSRLAPTGTNSALLDQGNQVVLSDHELAKITAPSNLPVIKDSRYESSLSLSMALPTRSGRTTRTCAPNRPCSCHIQTVRSTPRILQQLTGCLFLGYTGRPILQQQRISSCLRESSKSLQVTYFFPRWFVSRAISFSMSSIMQNTPTFNIKLRRVVSEASQLFSLSKFGDVEGTRLLFEKRVASPDDVHFRGGWTALHVSTCSIPQSCSDFS